MRTILLICPMLLVGCQPAYLQDGRPNENSPYFAVPVGSKLVLHRELTILPYSRHVFFQHGKAMPFYQVNEFIGYCALALHAQRKVPQTVKPDSFVVTRIYREHLYQLAGAPLLLAQVVDTNDGETWHVLATQMDLQSKNQPDVIGMTCAAWGLPQELSNVTVGSIRKSLGDIVTLALADTNAPQCGGGPPRRKYAGY